METQFTMTPSRIYTLFAEPQPERANSSGLVASLVLHALGFWLIALGLAHAPGLLMEPPPARYNVRVLTAPLEEPPMRQMAQLTAPGVGKSSAQHGANPGGHLASLPFVSPKVVDLPPGPQTLIQPDAPPQIAIPKPVPIPRAVIWSAQNSRSMTITAPPPPKVTVAAPRAAIIAPNREILPAEIKLSSTRFTTDKPMLMPSTTSPVVVRAPDPPQQVPQTASKEVAEPTPARVVSLSDTPAKDKAVIPFANSAARKASSDSLAPGQSQASAEAGSGNPASKQAGSGPGQDAARHTDNPTANGNSAGVAPTGPAGGGNSAAVSQNGTATGTGPNAVAGFGLGEPPLVHVRLPKDGQYSVVVVGSSLADKYPETLDVWGGRLIYTVYLHVGLKKNWILQYSVPRSAGGSSAGNTSQPAAPWPYDIVRSSAAPDPDADAILVHGIVNVTGHFEQLTVTFPPTLAQSTFLLHALQQWQFRPASQSGQPVPVEILLIIPNESE
ncbi:MAG TPA: hypothetical protein VGN01_20120 [Acidobacteriaceae bacterium]|jgi:hypothetical protein